MSIRDHMLSLAGVAGVLGALAVGGLAVGIAVAGVVGAVAVVGVACSAKLDPKPASRIAGLFTGLAVVGALGVGGLVYALEAEPAKIAATPDTPEQVVVLEDPGPLAAGFERADGSRAELVMPKALKEPGASGYAYLAPAP